MSTEKKDELFDPKNVPASNWFKMTKIGDRVKGEVVEMYEAAATGVYGPERVFGLKQEDGTVLNYGVQLLKKDGTPSYLNTRTKSVQLGDTVGFEFKDEIKSKTPGFAPAKSIEAYVIKGEPKVEPATSLDDIVGNDGK